MKLIKVTCPDCKANIKVGENSKLVICDYCRTEFLVDDCVKRIHKTITDEAKIKEQEVRNEMHARKIADKENERKHDIKSFLIIVGVLFLFIVIGLIFNTIHSKKYISMPESFKYYCRRNYKIVKNELGDLGFENIEVRKIDDLIVGIFSKEKDVESISIAGIKNFDKGTKFKKSDKVVITYHVFKNK